MTRGSAKKSYYAVIPAEVRYDRSIPAHAKLLYGEITALCSEKGYCWASNSYFGRLYKKSPETISRLIAKLIKFGYIKVEIDKKAGNKRRIYLLTKTSIDIAEKVKTSIDKSVKTPIDKNVKQNNKSLILHRNNTKKVVSNHVIDAVFQSWNRHKGSCNWRSHREITPDIFKAIELRIRDGFTLEQITKAISNYAAVLCSNEFVWSRAWTLSQFLTRKRPDNREELQLSRFIPGNFSFCDFGRSRLGKEREQVRADYSEKIRSAPAEDLKKAIKNPGYKRTWLVRELRPEIFECAIEKNH